jgi:alpha-amylase
MVFQILAHSGPQCPKLVLLRTDGVGKHYKNTMKFDGWRFDYVKDLVLGL